MDIFVIYKKKRPILLLEVLIACAIVILCAASLLSPQVYMAMQQQQITKETQINRFVNLYYAQILERLYSQSIPWDTLLSGAAHTIEEPAIAALGFKGFYRFSEKIHKPKPQEQAKNFYLINLEFFFTDLYSKDETKPPLKYSYKLFVIYTIPSKK